MLLLSNSVSCSGFKYHFVGELSWNHLYLDVPFETYDWQYQCLVFIILHMVKWQFPMVETFQGKLYDQDLNSLLYAGALRNFISFLFLVWLFWFSQVTIGIHFLFLYFWSSMFYWQLLSIVIHCHSPSCYFYCYFLLKTTCTSDSHDFQSVPQHTK